MKYKKTEGGTGKGGRGHSNMNHWQYTEEIKAECKKARRQKGKKIIRDEIRKEEWENE